MLFWGVWLQDGEETVDTAGERPLAVFLQEKWAHDWAKDHLDGAIFKAGYEVLPVHVTWKAHNPDEQ